MASQAAPLPQRANLASADRSSGSQTVLSTHAEEGQQGSPEPILQPVLRLRGASISQPPAQRRTPTIRWADDVVDNEGMGRKSSKVCCIWHAPRAIDESSDESSSDSSSSSDDSDSDSELDRARPTGRRRAARLPHDHDHEGNCDHEHGHEHGEDSESAKGKNKSSDAKKKRRRSPNAYERIPKPKLKGKGGSVTVTMDEQ